MCLLQVFVLVLKQLYRDCDVQYHMWPLDVDKHRRQKQPLTPYNIDVINLIKQQPRDAKIVVIIQYLYVLLCLVIF